MYGTPYRYFLVTFGLLLLLSAGFISSGHYFGAVAVSIGVLFSLVSLSYAFLTIYRSRSEPTRLTFIAHVFLAYLILPTLLAALLVNLKRGPWLGVGIALILLIALHARKLILPLVLIALTFYITIDPIHSRLAQSVEHFFIAGGRSEIWSIGVDLAKSYPLGIGFDNSSVLSSFSDRIPNYLSHFHNNSLNILVETGWLGLALYLIWVFKCICSGLKRRQSSPYTILQNTIACSLLSWQLAGLVEYNFGDSEVFLLALALIGILAALSRKEEFLYAA
jgi:O-antigen ligase